MGETPPRRREAPLACSVQACRHALVPENISEADRDRAALQSGDFAIAERPWRAPIGREIPHRRTGRWGRHGVGRDRVSQTPRPLTPGGGALDRQSRRRRLEEVRLRGLESLPPPAHRPWRPALGAGRELARRLTELEPLPRDRTPPAHGSARVRRGNVAEALRAYEKSSPCRDELGIAPSPTVQIGHDDWLGERDSRAARP